MHACSWHAQVARTLNAFTEGLLTHVNKIWINIITCRFLNNERFYFRCDMK